MNDTLIFKSSAASVSNMPNGRFSQSEIVGGKKHFNPTIAIVKGRHETSWCSKNSKVFAPEFLGNLEDLFFRYW